MFRRGVRAAALAAAVIVAATAGFAQMQPIGYGPVVDSVTRLRAGQYIWAPELAPEGPMLVVVNIATQKLVAYRNGVPIAVSTVSTGKRGHRTPLGVFTVLQKRVKHFSNIYSNAPMPFMQRLTWQGIALHGGRLPGYPASHGCIRLPHAFAKLLFGETGLGMTVVIVDQPEQVRVGPTAQLLRPGAGDPAPASWNPELSPSGPVSIVVSGADRRMIVLRNGIEIGSAPVGFDGVVDRVQAYILDDVAGGAYRWRRLTLPGAAKGSAPLAGTPVENARFEASDPFRRALGEVVGPGTTMVVLPDSLGWTAPAAGSPPPAIPTGLVFADWRRDASIARGR